MNQGMKGLLTQREKDEAEQKKKATQGLVKALTDKYQAGNMTQQDFARGLAQIPGYESTAFEAMLRSPTAGSSLEQNLAAAGYIKGTQEYQDAARLYINKPATQVNVDTGPKLQSGFKYENPSDPQNSAVTPIKGSRQELEMNTPTQGQATAGSYATRMAEAEKRLSSVEGYDPTNITDNTLGNIPLIGNYAKSSQGRQYSQSQKDWVRAKLRKESGAVIGADEEKGEIETYFPQPGDDAETIEQKRIARMIATNNMIREAGIGYKGKPLDIPQINNKDAARMKRLQELENKMGIR